MGGWVGGGMGGWRDGWSGWVGGFMADSWRMGLMMMSFVVLSETKTSIPPYTLWATFHHEKRDKAHVMMLSP